MRALREAITTRNFGLSRRGRLGAAGIAARGVAAPAIPRAERRTVRYRATDDLLTLDPLANASTPASEASAGPTKRGEDWGRRFTASKESDP